MPHSCYILKADRYNKSYIGYTVDFSRRIRQHNGEIVGGAKKTKRWRPWHPVCIISGFEDASQALRFEYRLQHPKIRKKAGDDSTIFTLNCLLLLLLSGDGSIKAGSKTPWPPLVIHWYNRNYSITGLDNVTNNYLEE